MKLSKDRNNLYTGLPKALLEHNGEELAWNAKTFDKSNYVKQEDPFEQINGFWAYLPPATQDKIFNVYKKIFAAFEEGSNTDTWMRLIRPLVTELFQYHDLADVKHWMDYHSSVRMPNDLDDVFSEKDDGSLTRERTYLKEDYRWLIASAIALRCMLPILGEFISRTGKEIGNTFKEYHATKLLAFSNINNSEPMAAVFLVATAGVTEVTTNVMCCRLRFIHNCFYVCNSSMSYTSASRADWNAKNALKKEDDERKRAILMKNLYGTTKETATILIKKLLAWIALKEEMYPNQPGMTAHERLVIDVLNEVVFGIMSKPVRKLVFVDPNA